MDRDPAVQSSLDRFRARALAEEHDPWWLVSDPDGAPMALFRLRDVAMVFAGLNELAAPEPTPPPEL